MIDPGVTFDCRAKQNWTVQWLNKLGYTFGTDHRLLAYVTGGVAASGLSINRKIDLGWRNRDRVR